MEAVCEDKRNFRSIYVGEKGKDGGGAQIAKSEKLLLPAAIKTFGAIISLIGHHKTKVSGIEPEPA